jgi:small-conductance mechanosensitive channel
MLLLEAGRRASLSDPFVEVVDLGNFSVTYRAAGFLTEVKQLLSARSRIRRAMLDTLHEAEIEIVSPTFMNQRQLARSARFIPQLERNIPRVREPQPEARIFDKADEAEVQARLAHVIDAQKQRVEALEESLRNGSLKAETDEINRELDEAKSRLDALVEIAAGDADPE